MDSTEYYKSLTLSKKLNIESSSNKPENVIEISSPTQENSVNLDTFQFPQEKLESDMCKMEESNSVDDSKALIKQILTSNISKNSFGGFANEQVHCRTANPSSSFQKEYSHCNLDQSAEHLIKEKLNSEKKIEPITQSKCLMPKENKPILNFVMKKIVNLPEGYTDSSHSSSSELQSSANPFESSSSSIENACKSSRINFENALLPTPVWKESNDNSFAEVSLLSKPFISKSSPPHTKALTSSTDVIPPDDKIEPAIIVSTSNNLPLGVDQPIRTPEFIGVDLSSEVQINGESINKNIDTTLERTNVELPVPAPVVPPTPRKRGRPRKQVLPNPSPLLESWGQNTPQVPQADTPQEIKRSTRSERRTRKKRFEDIENGKTNEECTPKRRYTLKSPLKKKRSNKRKPTYIPKKRGPKPGKKHAEVENIQNFEEETRMSASEGHGGFSGRSGTLGDESQSSFLTEGQTKSSINKKGRMEVMTDSCKPITVQQIVEYCWPPPNSISHNEKSENLMIQEQITEYLGVKSFKRKYPSIKRRPVEMEERNYLQENGFVSENMCDMGLTAVFSADIIEIMYNDFPQKFEEYRKHAREKKAKEQRALREKQAAERADMDPLREAVESAQAWNSEFNKTRRWFVMDTPRKTYSNNVVLLGNWFNKNCDDEYKLAMYVKKRERKDLLVIGVRTMFDNFLRHVPLSLSLKGLTYGGPFQLLSPDVKATPPNASESYKNGVILSVTVDANDIEKVQSIIYDLPVVGSVVRYPCARNAFLIESDEGKSEGEPLCYGDTIYLRLAEKTEIPLYLEILVPSLNPEVGTCGFPTAKLRLGKSGDARFKVVHVRPESRQLSDGSPCGPFERLILNHAPDNAPLCVETDTWKTSLFSYECEISARNKSLFRNKIDPCNVWMFLVGTV